MGFWKTIERLGYLRAARELQRLGYPKQAEQVIKQARELKAD